MNYDEVGGLESCLLTKYSCQSLLSKSVMREAFMCEFFLYSYFKRK